MKLPHKNERKVKGGLGKAGAARAMIADDPSFKILKLALAELGRDAHANIPAMIADDPSFKILKLALAELKDKFNLAPGEVNALVEEGPGRMSLPVSIFRNGRLSALEIICKYLKEELGLRFSEISYLLARDQRTVWTTYSNAAKKQEERLVVRHSSIRVPLDIFSDRKFSVLELLVSYLRDSYNLPFVKIASLLVKDPRNIWTVYSRYKKKKG